MYLSNMTKGSQRKPQKTKKWPSGRGPEGTPDPQLSPLMTLDGFLLGGPRWVSIAGLMAAHGLQKPSSLGLHL